jgi:hypothetical protein
MKEQFFKTKKNLIYSLSWVMLFTLFMGLTTSCDDDDDIIDNGDAVPVAYVSLYHVSPDGPDLDIQVDNNRVNYYPFEYTDYTGYLRFYTGERELKFTPFNASNTLFETSLSLEEDSLYSVFVTGIAGERETVVVHDEFEENDTDNTLIRIVHASPDAPAIHLSLSGEDDNLFDDVAYRDVSDFMEVEDGVTSFEILNAENGEVITSVSDVNFRPDRVYTLIVRGYLEPPAGTGEELSVQVVPNYYNL